MRSPALLAAALAVPLLTACLSSPQGSADASPDGEVGDDDGGRLDDPDGAIPGILLDLPFEGTTASRTGVDPLIETSVDFVEAMEGQGAFLASPAELVYPEGTLLPSAGSIDLWLQPNWAGDDATVHRILVWGDDIGVIALMRDGANNLRFIINLGGGAGDFPERGVGVSTNDPNWFAGSWHRISATWGADGIHMWIDGELVESEEMPPVEDVARPLWIGSTDTEQHLDGVIDELRVFGVQLGGGEVSPAGGG